jgi:hypothetical protein
MTDIPLILTTKDHRQCHDRWHQWKLNYIDRVGITKRLFNLAESSVRAFGPHVDDVRWIDAVTLKADVYGNMEPIDLLLDVLHFPADSEMVMRKRFIGDVRALIHEHEQYGSDGLYMPRSVILGWIIWQHDLLLSDIKEVA